LSFRLYCIFLLAVKCFCENHLQLMVILLVTLWFLRVDIVLYRMERRRITASRCFDGIGNRLLAYITYCNKTHLNVNVGKIWLYHLLYCGSKFFTELNVKLRATL
jgi:hypothetical protein